MSLTAWAVIIIAALMAVLGFVVSGWQEARGKFPARDTIKLVCAWAFVAAFWFVVFLPFYDPLGVIPYIRSEIHSALLVTDPCVGRVSLAGAYAKFHCKPAKPLF